MNISYVNDKASQQSLINSTVEIFDSLEKINAYVKVSLPEKPGDNEYRSELVRTVLDAEKLFKGIYSNELIKTLMENFHKSITYELKFPFKRVR